MKVTSDDCKNWIVKNMFPKTNAGDWKRRSKREDGDATVRVFKNDTVGEVVGVVERNGLIVGAQGESGNKSNSNGILAMLRANPVKVAFLPLPPSEHDDDLSGRVVYDLGADGLENEDGIGFYCGPETKGGFLHDMEDRDCGEKLKELFADLPSKRDDDCVFLGISVHDAENYHTISFIPDVSPRDLWSLVVERLERSGAVRMRK